MEHTWMQDDVRISFIIFSAAAVVAAEKQRPCFAAAALNELR